MAFGRQEIAKRLRRARELAGLSQAHVAGLLGVSRPAVSDLERGRRRVAAEELSILCDLYAVRSGWVLGETPASDGTEALLVAARALQRVDPAELDLLVEIIAATGAETGRAGE